MPIRKKVAIPGEILVVATTLAVWAIVQNPLAGPYTVGTVASTPAGPVAKPTTPTTEPGPPRPAAPSGAANLEQGLRAAGWQRGEIESFVGLSGDWFDLLYTESREQYEDQLKALARLGEYRRALKLVQNNPELAGLLALADQPNDLADILDTESDDLQTLVGLFARCADRHDLSELVIALKENREAVIGLLKNGLIGGEVLFVFDRASRGSKEYELWLRESVGRKLPGRESDLASFVQFALLQGGDVRTWMRQDEAYRRAFPDEMWPKLIRVLEKGEMPLEYYVGDPNLWKLLAHGHGEELLKRRGLLASELLFGPDRYATEHHDKVIEVLLGGDDKTFQALTESPFRRDPQFLDLLKRPLDGPILEKALTNLMAVGKNYKPLLAKYSKLSDSVLSKEVGPPRAGMVTYIPFYSTYEIAEKILDGRGASGIEIAGAAAFTAIDVTSVVFPLAKAGQFLKQSTKVVGKDLGREAVKAEVRELAKKAAMRNLTRHGAELLLMRGTEEQTVRWAVTGVLTTMIKNFKVFGKLGGKSATIDVTTPLRFFCNHVPYGKKTLERFAKLDAKVLMGKEGKVHLEVKNLACSLAENYLNGVSDKIRTEKAITALERNKQLSAWWLSNLGGGMPAGDGKPQ